jgi:hypothetical protein
MGNTWDQVIARKTNPGPSQCLYYSLFLAVMISTDKAVHVPVIWSCNKKHNIHFYPVKSLLQSFLLYEEFSHRAMPNGPFAGNLCLALYQYLAKC